MMRVRLKADGRIVEILADGSERAMAHWWTSIAAAATCHRGSHCSSPGSSNGSANGEAPDAAYARSVRARTNLTQAQFAAGIGVPIDTVRNWEQGKRSPRGPARALLKMIERAPQLAFALLKADDGGRTTDDREQRIPK
jgi:putative transcriptional regulator